MRPGQQNKRGRGRGSNNNNNGGGGGGNNNNFNRKGGNPLTRSYDSSGPDVKIRGTAQHIAEKYATLARDAQSSGDRVMAENYLQHAEHYNRIIASAQAQMQERFQRDDRGEFQQERDGDDIDGDDNDDVVVSMPGEQDHNQQRAQRNDQSQRNDQPERQERQDRPERQDRNERRDRRERPARQERQPREEQDENTVAPVAAAPVYDASSAPQPVIDGTPKEVAVEEEAQVNSAASERAPRRPRSTSPRPRRPRRAAGSEEGEAAAESTSDDAAPKLENAAE
ncbi:DUF4167 domain-containing protein [Rhizobium sp. Leaf262]|uniref:DUF4167 domain-containing protein n=1 Tax=Rhizobium sp. Leaf262 TaxID=1736312 RepID=UPI000714A896|nr:DUF4167 domain-containing protein [Rhizobium sp. Leaf262]KQO83281.1 hypothetical protein ASF29_00070 [Rhizobium sp. Leaf262]